VSGATPGLSDPPVYVSVCDAWMPPAIAGRLVQLILEAVEAGTPSAVAVETIDATLREDFGGGWTNGRAVIRRGIRRVRARRRANHALTRLGSPLTKSIPVPLQPFLSRLQQPLARHLAAANYQRKYRGRFLSEIDPEDDLLQYSLDVARTEPGFHYYRAVQMYFEGGDWNVAEVEKALSGAGVLLRQAGSMLEFACGYGRLTRHFVHMISPSRITVSDIDRAAVDFVSQRLNVRGFYSEPRAEQLLHDGRYDVIVVVSLFSHLPSERWGPWLRRLTELLNPGGALLFSVTGMHAWNVNVSDAERHAFEDKANGFRYRGQNETRGRLKSEDYGIAYVSEEFVKRAVAENSAGATLSSFPRALNGFQDAYVLRSRSSAL
jgi:2-polyprenyl-3-methyl-5-hydroxy-6-metoxy-1,4-benzoquinol methylase